jgi:hypothetical protein
LYWRTAWLPIFLRLRQFQHLSAALRPGDTILVHAGIYKDDRYRYGGQLGAISTGTYFLTQSGAPERPIVIKAAGDGELMPLSVPAVCRTPAILEPPYPIRRKGAR